MSRVQILGSIVLVLPTGFLIMSYCSIGLIANGASVDKAALKYQ